MLRALIEARLAGARRVASGVVDGLDDRAQLFLTELAQERERLLGLALFAFAALVVAIVAVVWAAATIVAFAWDTEWRTVALIGMMTFWIVLAVALGLRVRILMAAGGDAFRFSRRVAAEDVEQLREHLRP